MRLGLPLCCAIEDDMENHLSSNVLNSTVSTPSYVTVKPLTPPPENKSMTDITKGHSNGGSVPLTRVKAS